MSAQHKAIQSRIKDGAEALGFRVIVEKAILDGAGSVIETAEQYLHREIKRVERMIRVFFAPMTKA